MSASPASSSIPSSPRAPSRVLSRAPWRDRAGKISWLKTIVFIGLFLPAGWIALQGALSWLGPKPVTDALRQLGDWSVRFLAMSLAVTPLRFIGSWPKLFLVRRMLGLAALAYVLLHVFFYVVQEAWDVSHVLWEIVLRFYLTIGAVALLGLIALGVTSTDRMISRLGAAWHRLHTLVYAIVVLALAHYFIQSKINVDQSVLMSGIFLLLLGYRLMRRYGLAYSFLSLLLLAVATGFATMALESAWYGLATGVPALAVLKANLDFAYVIRPGWWVMAIGGGVALLKAVRPGPAKTRVRAVEPAHKPASAG